MRQSLQANIVILHVHPGSVYLLEPCTLCFISRVIWIEKSSLSWCNDQYLMFRWQMEESTISKKLSGGNLQFFCQNGIIATAMAPPRKCECVPDCYKKLHFWPLLTSMHFWLTSLIDYYTKNAFLFSGLAQKLHHCTNMVAPIEKSWRQKFFIGHSIKVQQCLIGLDMSCNLIFENVWHDLWNIVYMWFLTITWFNL